MTTPTKPTRQPAFVLLHSDGFAEFYGDKQTIDARIFCVPSMGTPAGEILAEEYISSILTPRQREIYYPGNRLARENWRQVTPTIIARRNDELSLLRALDSIKEELAKIHLGVDKAVAS